MWAFSSTYLWHFKSNGWMVLVNDCWTYWTNSFLCLILFFYCNNSFMIEFLCIRFITFCSIWIHMFLYIKVINLNKNFSEFLDFSTNGAIGVMHFFNWFARFVSTHYMIKWKAYIWCFTFSSAFIRFYAFQFLRRFLFSKSLSLKTIL